MKFQTAVPHILNTYHQLLRLEVMSLSKNEHAYKYMKVTKHIR